MKTAQLNEIRGDRIAMIFQDPMTSLNPYLTVERQMTEVLQFHKGLDRQVARAGAAHAGCRKNSRRRAPLGSLPA
jgi:oligopeptide transport system ATP-binding protein